MKVEINRDEWWPYYFIDKEWEGCSTEIPQDKIDWIEKVEKEHGEMQKYLAKKWEEQNDRH